MVKMSRSTPISRRFSSHPLRKALAATACAAGLIGLSAVPAAAAQAAGAPPRPGDTPAVSATGLSSGVLANLFYAGTDSHAYGEGLPPSGSAE